MWETSKREVWFLVWKVALMMLRSWYCTGMDQPAKGTIRPPWDSWKPWRAVLRSSLELWRDSCKHIYYTSNMVHAVAVNMHIIHTIFCIQNFHVQGCKVWQTGTVICIYFGNSLQGSGRMEWENCCEKIVVKAAVHHPSHCVQLVMSETLPKRTPTILCGLT